MVRRLPSGPDFNLLFSFSFPWFRLYSKSLTPFLPYFQLPLWRYIWQTTKLQANYKTIKLQNYKIQDRRIKAVLVPPQPDQRRMRAQERIVHCRDGHSVETGWDLPDYVLHWSILAWIRHRGHNLISGYELENRWENGKIEVSQHCVSNT